jgi:uncharacterized protein
MPMENIINCPAVGRKMAIQKKAKKLSIRTIKSPTIICGFPGFGLVGAIVTEFMVEHLDTVKIDRIVLEEFPPIIAIHDTKAIEPVSIYYNKKYNLIFVHGITNIHKVEWKICNRILELAKSVKAKEIICVEGVGSTGAAEETEGKAYYFANESHSSQKLKNLGIEPIREGYITGIIPALLLKAQVGVTCIFAQVHSEFPDSKAAAKIIETLDKYIGMDVDYKPLLDMAKKFEEKIRTLLAKQTAALPDDKKSLSYVG